MKIIHHHLKWYTTSPTLKYSVVCVSNTVFNLTLLLGLFPSENNLSQSVFFSDWLIKINQLHNPWRKNLYGVSLKAARGANLFPKTRPLSALMAKLRQHPQILEQSITAPDGFVPLVIGEKGHTFSQSSIDMYWEAGSSFWPGLFLADISTETAGVRLISPLSTANLSVQ